LIITDFEVFLKWNALHTLQCVGRFGGVVASSGRRPCATPRRDERLSSLRVEVWGRLVSPPLALSTWPSRGRWIFPARDWCDDGDVLRGFHGAGASVANRCESRKRGRGRTCAWFSSKKYFTNLCSYWAWIYYHNILFMSI